MTDLNIFCLITSTFVLILLQQVSSFIYQNTGRQWAAATTEGLFVYSLDSSLTFDPYDLTLNITPELILETLAKEDWSLSLILSHRLNEKKLVQQVVESIPPAQSK